MVPADIYHTIENPSKEVLYKDRGSKFFGYAYPIENEENVKHQLELLKRQHPTARHWCYAYQLGVEEQICYRANDDGEPNNSAGMPIYGQIQSFALTNVLVVIVRYFGGTKLGVSGLINAYKTSAQMALDASNMTTKTIDRHFKLIFSYAEMSKVMRTIKEYRLEISQQYLNLNCELHFSIRKSKSDEIYNAFKNLYKVNIEEL